MARPNKDEILMVQDQPAPTPNASRPIWDLVIENMRARDRVGRERYGTPLQANNGRDALVDLFQELLDAVVYTQQLIEERRIEAERTQDDDLLAASNFVDSLLGQADLHSPFPAWHGWALRDAFRAGIALERNRSTSTRAPKS